MRGALAFVAVALALMYVPAPVQGADPVIAATWVRTDLAVDGSIVDWTRLERVGSGPTVAVANDATSIYLAVASADPMVRQQLATGLVVWLDSTAKRAQRFGVRLEGLVRRQLPGETADGSASGVLERTALRNSLDEFDLLGPAKNQRRLIERASTLGFALASGVDAGAMIYELKVPLAKTADAPHAVGAEPGSTIAIGLETPADPASSRRREGLENPTSTMPWVFNPYGGYFNPPPPPSGDRGQPKPVVIKPMKVVWTLVGLAVDKTAPSR